jgi:hypothetical protein
MAGRIPHGFNVGGGNAESDPLLQAAYLDNGDYALIESYDDPRRFIIGRTGSGKSAVFERLELRHPEQVTRLSPENLSLSYISNLDVIKNLKAIGVRLDPFFNALWKHVIIVELLRHRYRLTSARAKDTILAQLLETFKRDPARQRAVEYLNTFGDKFWCEAHERVTQIADTFEQSLHGSGSINAHMTPQVGASLGVGSDTRVQTDIKREQTARYQAIVNQIQIPRLNEMIRILGDTILDSRARFTYLVVDDLDKEWADNNIEHLVIRCLFQAVVDLQRVRHLKVLVALRTNIFNQLCYREGGGRQQTEKFRNLAFSMRWTRNDLKVLLDQRVSEAARRLTGAQFRSVEELLPPARQVGPTGLNYLLDRTLLRPRDAIVFMNICLREAAGTDRISWDTVERGELEYSRDRLEALSSEWADPYPGLMDVFKLFRRADPVLTRDAMTELLDRVVVQVTDPKFVGADWGSDHTEHIWNADHDASWYDMYGSLTGLLYDIGFIGCSPSSNTAARYMYEDPLLVTEARNLEAECRFAVHPAFRRALEIA